MSQCTWCQSGELDYVLERRDRLGTQVFHYVRCRRCGLVRLEPLLDLAAKDQHYPPGYAAYQEGRPGWPFSWGERWYWSRRVRRVYPLVKLDRGDVLDVGCGAGGFLVEMQRRGWRVSGLEPNHAAAARACRRLGLDTVRAAHLEEVDFPPTSFDLVTLWDVLDHLQDPPAALRKIKGWLRPGGLLAVGVPHLHSWDARLFGPAWLGWDAPRHLYVFAEDTLRAVLEASGYQVVASGCFYGSAGSLVTSLDYVLQERLGASPLGRFLRGAIGWRVWRYFLWPYFRLAEWAGRGPIKSYLCRPVT